jgi:glycerol-3-phosphate dehydrogenase
MIPSREAKWNNLGTSRFDVLILGAGVSGACLFNQLCAEGYRVLLIDRKDFASATSQSSAMMIWGGLLYLKDFRFRTVWKLCGSRDLLIRTKSRWVKPQRFRYLVSNHGNRGSLLMNTALHSYWALGKCRSARPQRDKEFNIDFLRQDAFRDSFLFHEALLDSSDTRFALDWILSNQGDNGVALNYCCPTGATFSEGKQYWSIGLRDELRPEQQIEISSRVIVNCTGPWTDEVNKQFGIDSPFKHVLSKGVFVGFERFANHHEPLIMDIGDNGDCMSLIPWGPITLWGPTENSPSELPNALFVQPDDISLLLRELNNFLAEPKRVENIISIRHGVRALVADKDKGSRGSSLEMSRKFKIHSDRQSPWISVYGGKLTDCVRIATVVVGKIKKRLHHANGHPSGDARPSGNGRIAPELQPVDFPGLSLPVPAVRSCVEHEMCQTLEDYLRRRTNISQWVPRGGLGRHNENWNFLTEIARQLPTCNRPSEAESAVRAYEVKVVRELDCLAPAAKSEND